MDTDSAGTSGYHAGNPPDPRSQEIGRGWGLDMSAQRARQVIDEDFERFDVIYAMDRSNLQALRERCPMPYRNKVRLIMELAPDYGVEEVPDPYYGRKRHDQPDLVRVRPWAARVERALV